MKWRCLLLSFFVLIAQADAFCEVIHFNDGNRLHATVLEETDETITIDFDGRTSTLNRADIEKISLEADESPDPQPGSQKIKSSFQEKVDQLE